MLVCFTNKNLIVTLQKKMALQTEYQKENKKDNRNESNGHGMTVKQAKPKKRTKNKYEMIIITEST